jgi:hypothetical protein
MPTGGSGGIVSSISTISLDGDWLSHFGEIYMLLTSGIGAVVLPVDGRYSEWLGAVVDGGGLE